LIEACLIFANSFLCRTATLPEADSMVLSTLEDLADHGYPFASARVFVYRDEYLALISRGRFYVLSSPEVEGKVSTPLLRWFLRGLAGKAFNLSALRRRAALAEYYGVRVQVMRRDGNVVLRFSSRGGEIFGSLQGGREGLFGDVGITSENLLSLGITVRMRASYDSLNMYLSAATELPPLVGFGLHAEGYYQRVGDTVSYAHELLPYVWRYPQRMGIGVGWASAPVAVALWERVGSPGYRLEILYGAGEVGYRLRAHYGWLALFAFKGVGTWRERVGGMDRFREMPTTVPPESNFAVARLDVPLIRHGILSVGPFGDLLLRPGYEPRWAYGLFLRYGANLQMFVSASGMVGLRVGANL